MNKIDSVRINSKIGVGILLVCFFVVSKVNADTYIWNGATWSPSTPPSIINPGGDTYQVDVGNVEINSIISGANGLTKTGLGTLILSNDNTYSGGTTIDAGTLQISNGTTVGSVAGNIVNNGILVFYRSNLGSSPYVITNPISGSGVLHFKGTGMINQSAYQGNASNTIFDGSVIVENGARLELINSSTGSASGIIVEDGGSLWLENGTTYSSPIAIAGNGWVEDSGQLGALRMGGNALASSVITLKNNARIGVRGLTTKATISGIITDEGNGYSLEKDENGTLILSAINTYSGGTTINDGVISVSSNDNLGASTGGVTIGSASLQVTESFTSDRIVTLGHATASAVDVAAGKILTLTADFSNSNQLNNTGAGELVLDNISSFSGKTNIADGTVKIKAATFNNELTGTDTLAINQNTSANIYAFGPGVGTAFTGIIDLLTGTISLDGINNVAVLQNSTFKLGTNGIANLEGENSQILGDFTINGGSLRILNMTAIPMLTVGTLDAIATGEVWLPVSTSQVISVSDQTVFGSVNLYDYADFSVDEGSIQIVAATNVIAGETTLINFKDINGNLLETGIELDIKDPNETGTLVGKATIDYIGSVRNTITQKGIYFNYHLKQLEAFSGKTVTLNSTGSSSVNRTLNAKLSGAGGFKFKGDQNVKVGNTNSDYTGVSEINNLTVTMLTNSAFGQAQSLNFTGTGKLDMDGKSQTVGTLNGVSATEIAVGNLSITNGGSFAGTLTGTGTTTLSGGMFNFSGTQTGGAFNQSDGIFASTDGATLNNALFVGVVSPAGLLNVAGDMSINNAIINVNSNTGSIHTVGNIIITGMLNITGVDFTLGDYVIMEGATLSAADINNYTATFYAPISNLESYSFSIKDGNKLVLTMASTTDSTIILTQPQGGSVCKYGNYTFLIEAKGTNLSYQWYKGSDPISGTNSNKYTITNATEFDSGDYYVTVKGDNNQLVVSDTVILWVAEPLPSMLSFAEFPSTALVNNSYRISLAGYLDVTNYAWSYSKPGVSFDPSSGGANETMATFTTASIGQGTLSVELTHVCGNRTAIGQITVLYPTGLNVVGISELSLYPNPVVNELQIENAEFFIKQVIVSDVNGRIINKIQPNAASIQLSTGNWPKGIYFVRITTDTGSTTHKVIKK